MSVQVAVIGLGAIARKAHLPVLAALPDVEVVGLVSRSGRGVDELAAQYRFPVRARTLDEVIRLRPDAALVLTSSETHAEIACRLLEAGVDVYVEKPMALDLGAARAMAGCARRSGRILMAGFNRRYAPLYRTLRSLFAGSGPSLGHLAKHRDELDRKDPSAFAVWDDVIHMIDLARWLMGDPVRVRAALERGAQGEFLGLSALFEYPDGRSATLSQSYRAGGVAERVELHGAGRSAWVEDMETLHVLQGGAEAVHRFPRWTGTLARRGFEGALGHFVECVRTREEPEQSPEDALRSHELAQAILDAAR